MLPWCWQQVGEVGAVARVRSGEGKRCVVWGHMQLVLQWEVVLKVRGSLSLVSAEMACPVQRRKGKKRFKGKEKATKPR